MYSQSGALYLYRWRKAILLLWVLLLCAVLAVISLGPQEQLETELQGADTTPAAQVVDILKQDFGLRLGSTAALVLPADVQAEGLVTQLTARFAEIKSIAAVSAAKPHQYQLWRIDFKPSVPLPEAQALTGDIRAELTSWSQAHDTQVLLTGSTAFQYDAKQESKKDSRRGEGFALVMAFGVLLFTFGALWSSLLPLLMGVSSLLCLQALIVLFAWSVNPVSRILSSLVGLALSIDYALFIISRFREEKALHDDRTALHISLKQAGHTIFFSGLIMACSLSALLLPDVSLSRTVMFQLLIVIALAMFHALLILPALLAVTVGWLDWPPFLARFLGAYQPYLFWRRFSQHVVRHHRLYFVASTLALLVLAWPVTRMQLWEPVQGVAPRQSESMRAYRLLEQDQWGGELLPVVVAVRVQGSIFETQNLRLLYDLDRSLARLDSVDRVQSPVSGRGDFESFQTLYQSLQAFGFFGAPPELHRVVNLDRGANTALIYVFPRFDASHSQSEEIMRFTRNYAQSFQQTHPQAQSEILVGGVLARVQDFTQELYRYTHWVLLWILGGIGALLWLHMKTPILPLKAAFMNFLPIVAAFGVLVRIFQDGWGHSIFQTVPQGAVTNTVPLVLFAIVFGLSMDYEVLILSRVSEVFRETGDVEHAIVEGLARSGAVITGAVLILLCVFLPGMFSSSPQTQEICIGIAVAIFLDATLVRLFLVPSFMMLLGRWNWWPQQIDTNKSPD